jgi:hypothetical protein
MPPAVKRRLVTLAAAASLVLCVAMMALWVRSYWRVDDVRFFHTSRSRVIGRQEIFESAGGIVFLSHDAVTSRVPREDRKPRFAVGSGKTPKVFSPFGDYDWHFSGFGYYRGTDSFPESANPFTWVRNTVAFPHWFLALLFAILPAVHFRAAMRSRSLHRAGLCPDCGYDLRGTPDRCPECGATPAAPAAR